MRHCPSKAAGTTLSGNGSVTLFVVNGGSKLSLRGVSLAHCVGQYGGAIAVYSNSVLVMKSVRVSFSHRSVRRGRVRHEVAGRRDRLYDDLKLC